MIDKYDIELNLLANGIDIDRYVTVEEYAQRLREAEDIALASLKDKSE